MAKDKNSFVLYCDIYHIVKKLPDEKAGMLFKHILSYVNDENPQSDDMIIELAFEPIKQFLNRDLSKWKSKKQKQSEAGTLGNLKRWHHDIFLKVQNKEITLEEAANIANHRVAIPTDNTQSLPDTTQSGAIGSIADSVSVSVIDIIPKKNNKKKGFKKNEDFSFDEKTHFALRQGFSSNKSPQFQNNINQIHHLKSYLSNRYKLIQQPEDSNLWNQIMDFVFHLNSNSMELYNGKYIEKTMFSCGITIQIDEVVLSIHPIDLDALNQKKMTKADADTITHNLNTLSTWANLDKNLAPHFASFTSLYKNIFSYANNFY